MNELKHLKAGQIKYSYQVDRNLLDTFPNPHPESLYEVKFSTRELTSLCPVTGQPDYYHVTVFYTPDKRCIESKSLKLYFFSFRNTGMFAEDLANRILNDLIECCKPRWIKVICRMNPRGGIGLTVKVEHGNRPERISD
jgi:7-cyano-7-deazaguanine reductase